MRKTIKYLFLLLPTMLLFAGCSSSDDEILNLKVTPRDVTLDEQTNQATVVVSNIGEWTISSDQSWCTVSPSSGSGRKDVVVTGTDFLSAEDRYATLTIESSTETIYAYVTQKGTPLALTPNHLNFDAAGTAQKTSLTVLGTQNWTVTAADGVTVDPMQGNTSAELTVTLEPNTIRKEKTFSFSVKYGSDVSKTVTITQAEGPNNDPTVPELTMPENNAEEVSIVPEFRWNASTDADGDLLYYTVYYSTDEVEWKKTETVTQLKVSPEVLLETSTTYYWKVHVSDKHTGEAESEVWSFTTSEFGIMPDGSYTRYKPESLDGLVPIIIMGDGFLEEDCLMGGLFDQKANEGIEDFFSVEPYISYREHFKVYKVYAHSMESGASRWNEAENKYDIRKNTAFDTRYYGDGYTSTLMKTNDPKVYSYAQKIPGITLDVLNNTTVILIVNDPVYSGTCWINWEGRSVSIVPTCEGSAYSYRMTMVHEASGHGFGRLADEYQFSTDPIPADEVESLQGWQGQGAFWNVSLTNNSAEAYWRHFFGVSGYNVGFYAQTQYQSGLWRSEDKSVMRHMNHFYFNAISREMIVKRIMKNLGEEYSFEEFIAKDVTTVPPLSRSEEYLERMPAHTPPQLVR